MSATDINRIGRRPKPGGSFGEWIFHPLHEHDDIWRQVEIILLRNQINDSRQGSHAERPA